MLMAARDACPVFPAPDGGHGAGCRTGVRKYFYFLLYIIE